MPLSINNPSCVFFLHFFHQHLCVCIYNICNMNIYLILQNKTQQTKIFLPQLYGHPSFCCIPFIHLFIPYFGSIIYKDLGQALRFYTKLNRHSPCCHGAYTLFLTIFLKNYLFSFFPITEKNTNACCHKSKSSFLTGSHPMV